MGNPTQGQISRAIRAAQKAGLRIKAIRIDGTIVVDNSEADTILEPAARDPYDDDAPPVSSKGH